MTDTRVSQESLDAVIDPGPTTRVSQESLDAVIDPGPTTRVSQESLDAVIDPGPTTRVSQESLEVIWAPRIIRTPPTADLSGVGYADLLLHTPYVIDLALDQVVVGTGDTIVDLALDTVIDLAGDGLLREPDYVIATEYWT